MPSEIRAPGGDSAVLPRPATAPAEGAPVSDPDNPVLLRRWRGGFPESLHRGAWVVTDAAGDVLDGAGAFRRPIFARSSTKAIQALPLVETGAAAAAGVGPVELALACSSHNAEACHTGPVAALLGRLGLDDGALGCGAAPPGDPETRRALFASGQRPGALHHNCSGKHAGFLALACHLGVDPADYIDPDSPSQLLVREAMTSLCDLEDGGYGIATDGCSAPTFRLGLDKLATGIARVAEPSGLAPERAAACRAMTDAVAAHPVLVAGTHKRLCTALAAVTGGRLFPKLGAEAVYVVGERDGDRALALKIDDGSIPAMNHVVVGLLARLGMLRPTELEALDAWTDRRLFNDAGREVGRVEVTA